MGPHRSKLVSTRFLPWFRLHPILSEESFPKLIEDLTLWSQRYFAILPHRNSKWESLDLFGKRVVSRSHAQLHENSDIFVPEWHDKDMQLSSLGSLLQLPELKTVKSMVCLRLGPGGDVKPHIDSANYRCTQLMFFLKVPPEFEIYTTQFGRIPVTTGDWLFFNNSFEHGAKNLSQSEDRLALKFELQWNSDNPSLESWIARSYHLNRGKPWATFMDLNAVSL